MDAAFTGRGALTGGRGFSRRDLLGGLGAGLGLAGLPGVWTAAQAARRRGDGSAFSATTVLQEARALARAPYRPPPDVPERLRALDYDSYRAIRYQKDQAFWGRTPTPFSVELFAPGFLYDHAVDVFIVEAGRAYAVDVTERTFDAPSEAIEQLLVEQDQLAGFRLHYPLNREDYRDEFLLFQGASYFRAVSRGQIYGLSARGLAIDVAEPGGEEFPLFRRFWIERPAADANSIVVHALLDSERVTGAYRFGIYPGAPTTLDVEASLFARKPVAHLGVAPLTSMFLHGPVDGPDAPDYRPAVHDSLGLAIRTGQGDRLWRPLSNPLSLQLSAFVDRNPQGFGLIQRARTFGHYQDLEADYERRPSAWVAPRGEWGAGHVQLVEIPSGSEANDNIVAYWRPDRALTPDDPLSLAYRLTWPNEAPLPRGLARAARSGYGRTLGEGLPHWVIDYDAPADIDLSAVRLDMSASAGRLTNSVVQANPETGGFRIFFTLDPGGADLSELRLTPVLEGEPIGETWLYRWLRG